MNTTKLVMMANQVGTFVAAQIRTSDEEGKAVAGIADHIAKFWDPRMRAGIAAHLSAGGAGLDPLVRRALESLQREKA